MPTGISFKGLKEFQQKLQNLPNELREEIGGEVFAAAQLWEQRAKLDAPVDQGRLRNEIRASQTGELSAQVVCNIEYAPYVEWGTKSKISVPESIADYAQQFKGSGTSAGRFVAQKMIYAWMDRVGIPIEMQWIVWISIIVNGIKPHPFFFIQRLPIENRLKNNIRKVLQTPH